jgi:hypothetical protein
MPAKKATAQKSISPDAFALDKRVKKVVGDPWDQIRCAVADIVRDTFAPSDPDKCCMGPWVTDIFDDAAVFEMDGKLFSVNYTYENGTATLQGDPQQVTRTYTPVGGGAAPPAPATPSPAPGEQKQSRANLAQKAQSSLDALKKHLTPSKGA